MVAAAARAPSAALLAPSRFLSASGSASCARPGHRDALAAIRRPCLDLLHEAAHLHRLLITHCAYMPRGTIMLANWTGWHIRRNEVVCQYEFHLSDPLIMQIHLTVEEDFMGVGPLHKFLHVLAYPCPIPAADSTLDGITFRTQDGLIDTGWFPVLSTRAERNGSLVINVPSQEKGTDCLQVLASGENMFLWFAIAGAVYDIPHTKVPAASRSFSSSASATCSRHIIDRLKSVLFSVHFWKKNDAAAERKTRQERYTSTGGPETRQPKPNTSLSCLPLRIAVPK